MPKKKHEFTKDDDNFLKSNYGIFGPNEDVFGVGCTHAEAAKRRKELGITPENQDLEEEKLANYYIDLVLKYGDNFADGVFLALRPWNDHTPIMHNALDIITGRKLARELEASRKWQEEQELKAIAEWNAKKSA